MLDARSVRTSIHRYRSTINPTNDRTPRTFAGPKSAGTRPIGASFFDARIRARIQERPESAFADDEAGDERAQAFRTVRVRTLRRSLLYQ